MNPEYPILGGGYRVSTYVWTCSRVCVQWQLTYHL